MLNAGWVGLVIGGGDEFHIGRFGENGLAVQIGMAVIGQGAHQLLVAATEISAQLLMLLPELRAQLLLPVLELLTQLLLIGPEFLTLLLLTFLELRA